VEHHQPSTLAGKLDHSLFHKIQGRADRQSSPTASGTGHWQPIQRLMNWTLELESGSGGSNEAIGLAVIVASL
jgi:hypothetical protein